MALIDIRPIDISQWGMLATPFTVSRAAGFAFARDWDFWKLYINGRMYNWPEGTSLTPVATLKEHIEYCIEIDEAFYEIKN